MKGKLLLAMAVSAAAFVSPARADIVLGGFDFNSQLFGNTLSQSDGGTFAAANWLNIVNADPGSPGYLTGANFNTGIANIGLGATPVYTIGYNTAIVNGAGFDLGIVTARFSTSDTVRMDVSTDGGTTFEGFLSFLPAAAVATGVPCSYFYAGGGPFGCELFVTPVDLSDYGLAIGASINTVRISGAPELDLIRVAGFGDGAATVPEPGTLALIGAALGLAGLRRRKAA